MKERMKEGLSLSILLLSLAPWFVRVSPSLQEEEKEKKGQIENKERRYEMMLGKDYRRYVLWERYVSGRRIHLILLLIRASSLRFWAHTFR
jgi:hypothetical protein